MQRITKYSLLLKAVHKHTESEEQRAELTVMVRISLSLYSISTLLHNYK